MSIEQTAEALGRIVSPDQEVERLGGGYGGGAVAEGPLWWKESGYLLFSDIGNSQRLKWAPGEGVSVFHEPTNNANGLTRGPQGRLIACEHGTRRVARQELDGSITVESSRSAGIHHGTLSNVGAGQGQATGQQPLLRI